MKNERNSSSVFFTFNIPVTVDEMLCELETDKVTVEVPSSVEGLLSEIVAKEGDTVGLDSVLATISEGEIQSSKPPSAIKEVSVETLVSNNKSSIAAK